MGYETTLIVGVTTNHKWYNHDKNCLDNDFNWFQEYARIDLCKAPAISRTVTKGQAMYFCAIDGNTQITVDRYGQKLFPHSAREILAQLKDSEDEYRRYKWAIALLENMVETADEPLHVLLFGH
jgi:hypothetical protein